VELRLSDGAEIVIRPIRPDDKAALAGGLENLSAETVRRRFLTAKPRFSAAELRYLTEVDGFDHFALVAVPRDEPDAIVAVGRFVRDRDHPATAEFAIVVGDAYQRRGLGGRLSRLLVDAALERGVERFTATVLSDNEAVRRLIASMAERLVYAGSKAGANEVVLDLAA
jgi:RimJ/RimL family protein N-acetyltransferase